MAYRRFPIPEFDHKAFRGLEWSEPDYLMGGDISKKLGSADTLGVFPLKADGDVLKKFSVYGGHCHALLCKFPAGTRLIGRSYSWWLQRAVLTDSLISETLNVIADWSTPRPMNTRFGPEDGVELDGKPIYVISCHGHSDHWVGNRTLVQNLDNGFRILGCAKDDTANFYEFCLTFTWGT